MEKVFNHRVSAATEPSATVGFSEFQLGDKTIGMYLERAILYKAKR